MNLINVATRHLNNTLHMTMDITSIFADTQSKKQADLYYMYYYVEYLSEDVRIDYPS